RRRRGHLRPRAGVRGNGRVKPPARVVSVTRRAYRGRGRADGPSPRCTDDPPGRPMDETHDAQGRRAPAARRWLVRALAAAGGLGAGLTIAVATAGGASAADDPLGLGTALAPVTSTVRTVVDPVVDDVVAPVVHDVVAPVR